VDLSLPKAASMAEKKSADEMISVGDSLGDLIEEDDAPATKAPYEKSPRWLKLGSMLFILAIYAAILTLAIMQGKRQCTSML
jgi:hypothetical protein